MVVTTIVYVGGVIAACDFSFPSSQARTYSVTARSRIVNWLLIVSPPYRLPFRVAHDVAHSIIVAGLFPDGLERVAQGVEAKPRPV